MQAVHYRGESPMWVDLASGQIQTRWAATSRSSGRLPDNAHAVLNTVILHVSLPAVTLRYLHDFRFNSGAALWPVLMP